MGEIRDSALEFCPRCKRNFHIQQYDNYKECSACGYIFQYHGEATEMGLSTEQV